MSKRYIYTTVNKQNRQRLILVYVEFCLSKEFAELFGRERLPMFVGVLDDISY